VVSYGPEYPKINGLWKRDEKGTVLIGEWSTPEFAYLASTPWTWTEKIDGTNIRIHWDGSQVTIGGRTDKAQLPGPLVNNLTDGRLLVSALWKAIFPECDNVTLYGEGYGAGIQKGGGNYRPDQDFILFDIRVGDWWLKREDVEDVADKMGVEVVPVVDDGYSPREVWEGVKSESLCSAWPGVEIEGYVGHPKAELYDRRGNRITMKIKMKDWHDYLKKLHA